MHLIALATLPLLASAFPFQGSQSSIPLTRRSAATVNGVAQPQVLLAQLAQAQSKYERSFKAFELNMGQPHSLATAKGSVDRRAAPKAPQSPQPAGTAPKGSPSPQPAGTAPKGSPSPAGSAPNGAPPQPAGAQPNAAPGLNIVDLQTQQDVLWFGTIQVGTPPVSFTVDFDTGSSDLFLPATDCNVDCNGHKLWSTAASTTAKNLKANFSLAFGDGSTVQGTQFSDDVVIAGLTASRQTVGASSQYSTGFAIANFQPDGLMGMAFPQIAVFNASPVFETLIAQKQVAQPVFSVNLADTGAELVLGGFDPATVNGQFTFTPVTDVGFWQVVLDDASVNQKSVLSNLAAIIDTGTTLIVGDTTTVAQFYAAIPGSQDASATLGGGLFTLPCNNIPDISLTFGGKAFPISADTFNLGLASANDTTTCVGGLAGANLGPFWVVGDVFLRNVVAQFDVGQTRVGFATPSNTNTSAGPAAQKALTLNSGSAHTGKIGTGLLAASSLLLAALML